LIDVTADNTSDVSTVQTADQQLLEARHHITNPANDDFAIQNQQQLLATVQGTSQTLTILLVGVASISLVVVGIGIKNIMLVSVIERTREIGIRMATGHRSASPLMHQGTLQDVALKCKESSCFFRSECCLTFHVRGLTNLMDSLPHLLG